MSLWKKISLGVLIVLVLLLEQLYRAERIRAGERYHK